LISETQSPRAARFKHVVFAQPRHRRRIVDFAPPPARVKHDAALANIGGEEAFIQWLFERAGVDAACYRRETLLRRLPACLRLLRVNTWAAARLALQRDPSRLPAAIGAMLIGVTSFFRDEAVFDHLTYTVLRGLRHRSRGPRIWSAGCSDGEEMYSIAILLAELNLLDDAYLLGTDCRAQAIGRARAGCYPASALRDVPADWVDRYFVRQRAGWQVDADARRRVQWRTGDVTRVREPGEWDAILCRNMAMYMRSDVAAKLWQSLESCLRPGGFLVLGKAERPVGATRLSAVAPCIYRKNRV
jgi:chemotaxis methyl-accepting protein methylase